MRRLILIYYDAYIYLVNIFFRNFIKRFSHVNQQQFATFCNNNNFLQHICKKYTFYHMYFQVKDSLV